MYKIAFTCDDAQVATFTALLMTAGVRSFSASGVEPKPAPDIEVRQKVPYTKIKGGTRASDRPPGKAILSLFKDKCIIRISDMAEALAKIDYEPTGAGGYASIMLKEGTMVKCGYGAYRLPTPSEQGQTFK